MSAEKRYTLGWILGAVAYVFPLIVGTRFFIRMIPPMLSGGGEYDPFLHVGLANLMFTGFSGIVFCCYGLRRRIRAFWFLHLMFLLWVVTNDLFAAVYAGWAPMPLAPGSFGLLGLLLTASCLRQSQDSPVIEGR